MTPLNKKFNKFNKVSKFNKFKKTKKNKVAILSNHQITF